MLEEDVKRLLFELSGGTNPEYIPLSDQEVCVDCYRLQKKIFNDIEQGGNNNGVIEKINYDHIYNKYYWWVVVLVIFGILLFFLILVLIYLK